jgi:preprotein translocase subunit Sec63
MTTYQKITAARNLLELPEQATLAEIKSHYRKLMKRYHPDRCTGDKNKCEEIASRLSSAYKLIMSYCTQYKFSFANEEVRKYIPKEEWWFERFGDDPLWSSGKQKKNK